MGSMTTAHKEALAAGRASGRAVRLYLEAIETTKPRRGRRPSPEAMRGRLAAIEEGIADGDVLQRLHLLQERTDLLERLSSLSVGVDLTSLEDDFVKVAREYGARRGITSATWREAGVSSEVLARAGVTRHAVE
jgi:hypothetical protein